MKTLTVRLPDPLAAEIRAEAEARRIPRSDVVRERLQCGEIPAGRRAKGGFALIADLVGSVRGLPMDLSARRKHYLKATGYGQKSRR